MSEGRDSSREKKQRNYYKYEPEGQQASNNASSENNTESISMQGISTIHRSRTRPNNGQNSSKNFMFIHVPVPSVILKDSRISEFSNQESIHYGMLEKLIQSDPTPTDTTKNSQTTTNVLRDQSRDGIQESNPQTDIDKENSGEGNLIKNETEKSSKDNNTISTKNKQEFLKSKNENNSSLQEYLSPKKEAEKSSTGEEKPKTDTKKEKTEKLNKDSDLSSKNKAEFVKSKNTSTKNTPLFEFMSSTMSATIIGSETNLGRLLLSGESGSVVTQTLPPMTSRGSGNIVMEYGEDKNKARHRSLLNSVRYSEPDEGAPRIRVSVIQKNPVNSTEARQKVCRRYSNSGKVRPISCAGVSLGRSVGTGTKSSNRYGSVDDCDTALSNDHCNTDFSGKNAQEICMDGPKNTCNLRCCCCLTRPTCPQSNNTQFSVTSSCQTTPESREISTDGYQKNEEVGSKNNNNSCCCCCCCSRCTNREKSTDGCQRNEDLGCKKNHNSCCCCCCSNRCTNHEVSTDGHQKSEDVGCKTNSNSCCCSSRCPTPKSMVTVQTQTGSQTKLQSTNCEMESGGTYPCTPQNATSFREDPTKSSFCPNVAITRPSWGFNPEGRAALMSYMQNNTPTQPFYSSLPPNFNTPVSLPSNNYPTQNYSNPIPPFYSSPGQNYNYPSPSNCVNPNQNNPGSGSPFYSGQMMNNPTPAYYGNSTQNNTNPGLSFNSSQRQSNVPFPALQNNPRKTREPPTPVPQSSSRRKNSNNNTKTDPASQKQTIKRNTKPELRNDSIQSSSKDNIIPEKTSGITSNVKVSQNESNKSISSSDTNLKPVDSESESLIKNSVNFEDATEKIPSRINSSSSQINADSSGSLKNSSSQNKKNSPVTFTRSRNRINDIPLRNWKDSPGQQVEISPRSKPRSRSPPTIKNSPAQLNTNSQPEFDASQNLELTYNDSPSQMNSNPQPTNNYTNSMLYNNDPGIANYTNPMPYNNDQGQGNYMNLMQGNYMNPMPFSANPGPGNYMNPIQYNNNPGFSNYMNPMPYNNNPGFPNYMMPMAPGLVNVMVPQPSIGNPESSRHSNSEAGSSSTSGSRRDSRSTDSPPTEISSQTDTSTSTTRSNSGRRGSRARRQANDTDCSSPLILSLAEKLKKALEVKEQNDLVSLVDMITSIPSCPPCPPPPPPQCCTRNNCSLVPSCIPCETKAKPLRKFPRCPNPCPQCCRTPCCCNNNLFAVCTTCTKAPCSCPKPVACCPRPSKNVCCYQARSPSKCRNDLFKSVKLNSVPKACCSQKQYRNKKCTRKDKIVLMEVDECGNDVMYVEKR